MPNNTDSGRESAGPDQPSPGAPPIGGNFDTTSTPPFGDPDQRLYGGTGADSPVLRRAVARGDSAYQGRHRAAD